MPRLPGLAVVFAVLVLVMGCVPTSQGSGTGPAGVTPNAVAGGAIEVTPLDVVAATDAPPATAPTPAVRPRETEVAAPQADPAPEVAAPAPVPTEEAAPEVVKSDAQIACEKKGSKWTSVGKSTLKACVKLTKDANKQCTRASQCESTCLARSRTCAPFKPLLGCNDILQDDGSRVTLCIE